jgi:hypothetical protein
MFLLIDVEHVKRFVADLQKHISILENGRVQKIIVSGKLWSSLHDLH